MREKLRDKNELIETLEENLVKFGNEVMLSKNSYKIMKQRIQIIDSKIEELEKAVTA